MTVPDEQQMRRAAAALLPFARRWHLSLNPEDLDETGYATLRDVNSDEDPEEIVEAVERQIDEQEIARRMLAAAPPWTRHTPPRAQSAGNGRRRRKGNETR